MAQINLLPWRAERRKLREREFYMMLLGAAVAAFAVVVIAILFMGHLIDSQNDRNTYLQGQIAELDKKIAEISELDKTRSQLLTRKDIIEQLQSNRSQMVHLFDDMVKTIPDGVRLTSMKQVGDTLTLEGVAESNSRVASYMRGIDASPWMGHTDLVKIENLAGAKGVDKKLPYQFSLDVKLRKPEDAQSGEHEATPANAETITVKPASAASTAPPPTAPAGDPQRAAAPVAPVNPATPTPASPNSGNPPTAAPTSAPTGAAAPVVAPPPPPPQTKVPPKSPPPGNGGAP